MNDLSGTLDDNFSALAQQHYLGAAYRRGPWLINAEASLTRAPNSEPGHAGYFAYRLTRPHGGSNDEKFSEAALGLDLAYTFSNGFLDASVLALHFTRYDNRTDLPDLGPLSQRLSGRTRREAVTDCAAHQINRLTYFL